MSGFYITNKKIKDEKISNKYLLLRGKDKQLSEKIGQFHFLYNILLMYNDYETWYGYDEIILLYDGVLYNSAGRGFLEMARFLCEMYKEYGTVFTQRLEGEYAFCLID